MKRSTEWIYEFSAQNTIVVSRTFFTQEVNEAFEELEEGNEDALKVRRCSTLVQTITNGHSCMLRVGSSRSSPCFQAALTMSVT